MKGFGSMRESRRNTKTSQGRWSHSIENLKTEARKSIWFAFQTLIDPKSEMVQTHTLKVLTASIGNSLGIEKSEELHDKTDVTELDFNAYFKLLESVMFDPLSRVSNETMDLSSVDSQEVHNVCWVLFYNHEKGKSIAEEISENIAFKMWIMFNLFAEEDDSNEPILPLKLDPEEARIIYEAIISQVGNKNLLSKALEALGNEPVSYQKYLGDFYVHIYNHVKDAVLKSSVDTVYEQFVLDILKKGYLSKRGHQVKNWKERYMVLTPKDLKYYVSSHQKHMKGTIVFEKTHSVELLPDKGGKRNLFVLNTPQKPYEMCAMDMKTRNEWMAGIQIGIDHCDDPNYHHQKEQSKVRRQNRNLLRKQKEEEERKRKEEEENQRKLEDEYRQREQMNDEMLQQKLRELEDEKKARAELEALLKEQSELREAERKRLLELEAIKAELERLLELERQAKRDEETVRKLQAKLLEEESEKREEMERLKKEQEQLLQHEREMREGLEGQWEEKDKILAEAQNKLSQLEAERLEASEKLEKAAERLQQAEIERHKMEEKVKLWKKPNVGLARPIQPTNTKLVTHRGEGAFCASDFLQKSRLQDRKRGMTKEQLDEKYGEHVEDVASDEEDAIRLKSPLSKVPPTGDTISTSENESEKDNNISKEGEVKLKSPPKAAPRVAKVSPVDHILEDKTDLTENDENQTKESIMDDKTKQGLDNEAVSENINKSTAQDESQEVKNENNSKSEQEQSFSDTQNEMEDPESQSYSEGDNFAHLNAKEKCHSDSEELPEHTDVYENMENANSKEGQRNNGENLDLDKSEKDDVVQSPYENVTFNFQKQTSEEDHSGEIENGNKNTEHSQNNENFDSSQNQPENTEKVICENQQVNTEEKNSGINSLPSFSNELYENVDSESYQEKPEKEENLENVENPDVYDYVEIRKPVF